MGDEVKRLKNQIASLEALADDQLKIHRCPFSGCAGVFEKSPHGPADTFTCNSCGAVVLPGRKP